VGRRPARRVCDRSGLSSAGVWVLEGPEDWATNETGALQVWPGQWFAARCAVGDRSAMQPGFVEPEDWDGLDEDYDRVGLFATPEEPGVEMPTSDFLGQLQGGPLTKLLTPDHSERVWGRAPGVGAVPVAHDAVV
jgi:hypothetical protein